MSDNNADNDMEAQSRASQLSPVALAFMGDAVFEMLVRSYLINELKTPCSKLHLACVGFVKASSQAKAAKNIQPLLSEEERMILRRGRNANTTHVPKNAIPSDYRYATGLEALFGYLYLCGRQTRINEIFKAIVELMGNNEMISQPEVKEQ
jgi:ribonuclease-3 family protein